MGKRPNSQYDHRIPAEWILGLHRIDTIQKSEKEKMRNKYGGFKCVGVLMPILSVILVGCAGIPKEDVKQSPILPMQISNLASEQLSAESCTFTELTGEGILLIGKIVAEAGDLQYKGVLISKEKIVDIGSIDAMKNKYMTASRLECQNSYFSPGFINAHEHTSFSYQNPDAEMQAIYEHREEWQKGLKGKRAVLYSKPVSEPKILAWVELRHLLAGETVIAGSGSFDGLTQNVTSKNGNFAQADLNTFPFTSNMIQMFSDYCKDPRSDQMPNVIFDQALQKFAYVPHVGEGIDCTAEGEIKAYFSHISNQSNQSNQHRKFSMIHALPLQVKDIDKLKQFDISIIWSPRSNVVLYGKSLDPIPLLDAGVSVALGTDWSPSGSFNILEEMHCAETYTKTKSTRSVTGMELWKMTTIEAAKSLGIDHLTGSIAIGKIANIVVIADPEQKGLTTLSSKSISDIWGVLINGQLMSIENGKVSGALIENLCKESIGSKKLCISLKNKYGFDLQEISTFNANNVDLVSTKKQANCVVQ